MQSKDLNQPGVIWRDKEKEVSYDPVEECADLSANTNGGYIRTEHHCGEYGHWQIIDQNGRKIWIEPPDKNRSDHLMNKSKWGVQGPTRTFRWGDKELGISNVKAYPDRPIPGLHCPDCGCQAVETDQVGVALCSGTPGWYFYYRERTNGVGQPEPKMEIVNGELTEVLKDKDVTIEREPTGGFREVKPDGSLGKEAKELKRKESK